MERIAGYEPADMRSIRIGPANLDVNIKNFLVYIWLEDDIIYIVECIWKKMLSAEALWKLTVDDRRGGVVSAGR